MTQKIVNVSESNNVLPNPSDTDLSDPLFNAIWEVTKTWDVNAPEYYEGYCGLNGSHVMIILNAIRAILEKAPSVSGEPFGHFKAEPFGWTDCSQSDDGAVALYETPQPDRVAELEAKLKAAVEALTAISYSQDGYARKYADEALAKIKE